MRRRLVSCVECHRGSLRRTSSYHGRTDINPGFGRKHARHHSCPLVPEHANPFQYRYHEPGRGGPAVCPSLRGIPDSHIHHVYGLAIRASLVQINLLCFPRHHQRLCVHTLLLMTLDRYLARVHPARSTSFRTNRNMWIAVFVVWLLNMASHVPFMLPYQVVHTSDGDPICVRGYDCQQNPMAHSIFNASFFALSYVLPLVVIMVLFGLVIKHLFQLSVERCLHSGETSHSNNQATRIVVIAVFIFAIFWMPFHVLSVLDEPMIRGDRDNETLTLMKVGWIVSQCLILMKSCINPILYAILSDSFRKSFQKSLSLNRAKPCVQESDNLLGDKRTECETAAACV